MEIFSFPPISEPSAEVLILGTMPGERSLSLGQYYGHRGNQFWKIMFELHGQALSLSYDLRARLLIENKFALWDVLKACRRQGSADSNILSETPNDFNEFLARHPKIRLIAFNGKKAAAFFDSHVDLSIIIRREILPSTSSANGWMSYIEKVKEWGMVLKGNLPEDGT
jgi:hypoxanthine-DNA glycosylase